jgi:uncharacterized protein YegL
MHPKKLPISKAKPKAALVPRRPAEPAFSSSAIESVAGIMLANAMIAIAPEGSNKITYKQVKGHGGELKVEHSREETRVVKSDVNVDVSLVLDVSGSMAGGKSKVMYSFVDDLINRVLRPKDGVGIVTFGSETNRILPLTNKDKVEFPTCVNTHVEGHSFKTPGSRTKLFDSIHDGLEMCARRVRGPDHSSGGSLPYLVIVTDGEDNTSKKPAEMVKADLQEPGKTAESFKKEGKVFAHFHVILVSIGSEADEVFANLSKGAHHITHISAGDAKGLKKAFVRVTREITKTFVVTETISLVGHRTVKEKKDHKKGPPTKK